jgi:glycosyltransferase involved in cell wall biosynthesis
MRICLLGNFTGIRDEGMKNISKDVRDRLTFKHEVLALNSRDFFTKAFFRKFRSFKSEIIHYLHGPTIRSLIILRFLKFLSGNRAKTIISATRPYFSLNSRWAVRLLRPNLILSQSMRYEIFFKQMNCSVKFFPNGVDCQKFVPATESEKVNLRKTFGLPMGKIIILHVGHIKPNRNLQIFKKIQKMHGVQVVIVGSTTEKTDKKLIRDLKASGIQVYHKFFGDITRLYKLADLYVFPVQDGGKELPEGYNLIGAIDLPLSVLEAMACNLPVITTPFGALPRLFEPRNGLKFIDSKKELIQAIESFSGKNEYKTREMVLPCDWKRIISRLENEYLELIEKPAAGNTNPQLL